MDEEKYKIILRHDNSTNWTLNNPILVLGEYGVEDDTHRVKRGDGVTPWVELQYETFGIDISVEDELADRFVEKEDGKGLSTNDFTDDYKNKLDHIEPEAQRNVQSDWDQQDNTKDDFIKNKPTKVSVFENDADYDTQTGVRTKISIHNTSDDAHLDIRQTVINETNRAKYAENEIAALINGESSERQAADARLQENINVERDTRILGDTILQDNIDNEAVLRRDADSR